MIAVTGASGFLGSHFVKQLRASGGDPLCLVRPASARAERLRKAGFRTAEVAFENPDSLKEALRGTTVLVHALGLINGTEEALEQANVTATRNLMDAAREAGVGRVLFISSVAALRRHGGYGESKFRAEELVRASGIPFDILRPAFIYGAGDENNTGLMMKTLRMSPVIPLLGGGDFRLQPVYVGDVTALMMKVLEARPSGQGFNVAGPAQISLKQILQTLAAHLGVKRLFLPIPLKPVQAVLRTYLNLFPKTRLPAKQILELDKHEAFDISETENTFGFHPAAFPEGARRMFEAS